MPSEDTKELLIDAKLDLVRADMRSGFSDIKQLMMSHISEDDKAHNKIDELESRIRNMEIENARSQTKLQVIGLFVSLASGGAGAFLSKLF